MADPACAPCSWIRAWRIGPCRNASRDSTKASGCCCRSAAASFPRYLTGLDEEFQRQEYLSFSASDAVLDYLDSQHFNEADWAEILQAELLALPGWAGLMRRLEEDPSLAPHKSLPCSLMDFPGGASDDGPRGLTHGRGGDHPAGEPAQDAGEAPPEPHRSCL